MTDPVASLWRYVITCAGRVPLPPVDANNYTSPLVVCYHRARRHIEAHPEHARAVAASARKEMQRLVRELTRQVNEPEAQGTLWEAR